MKKNIIILGVAALLLSGCGGGNSTTSVDNSTLTDTSNQYGYFGENVMFGDYTAARSWTLINENTNELLYLYLNADGDLRLSDGGFQNLYSDYGVSIDGQSIRSADLNDIHTTGVKKDYYEVVDTKGVSEFFDCYSVSGGDVPISMCPR